MTGLETPVVLVIFRRPELTRRVLGAIRRARPRTLLVIADGPSAARAGEDALCAAARAVVDELVDWPCRLLKNYADENLGVARRFDTGFRWAFEQVEEAIFLEDDELPNESFFRFCGEMLARYRDDERVSVINGTNFIGGCSSGHGYYFSRYFHCWGFATWRRFWEGYDVGMRRWAERRETPWLAELLDGRAAEAAYHAGNFDQVVRGEVQTWDYQVTFAMWDRGGLAVTPGENLVSNIGFGAGGLHYTDAGGNPFAAMETKEMRWPLSHPPVVGRDAASDALEYERVVADYFRMRRPRRSLLRRAVDRLRGR